MGIHHQWDPPHAPRGRQRTHVVVVVGLRRRAAPRRLKKPAPAPRPAPARPPGESGKTAVGPPPPKPSNNKFPRATRSVAREVRLRRVLARKADSQSRPRPRLLARQSHDVPRGAPPPPAPRGMPLHLSTQQLPQLLARHILHLRENCSNCSGVRPIVARAAPAAGARSIARRELRRI